MTAVSIYEAANIYVPQCISTGSIGSGIPRTSVSNNIVRDGA